MASTLCIDAATHKSAAKHPHNVLGIRLVMMIAADIITQPHCGARVGLHHAFFTSNGKHLAAGLSTTCCCFTHVSSSTQPHAPQSLSYGDAILLQVTLSNNSKYMYTAQLGGTEQDKDLAVIKIDCPPAELAPIEVGMSSKLVVGQKVRQAALSSMQAGWKPGEAVHLHHHALQLRACAACWCKTKLPAAGGCAQSIGKWERGVMPAHHHPLCCAHVLHGTMEWVMQVCALLQVFAIGNPFTR